MCVCLSTHLLDWRTLPSLVYLISSAPLPMHVRQVWKLAQSAAWLAYLLPTSAQAYVTHVKVTAVGAVSRRAFQPVIYKTWRTFLLSSFQFLGFGGRVLEEGGFNWSLSNSDCLSVLVWVQISRVLARRSRTYRNKTGIPDFDTSLSGWSALQVEEDSSTIFEVNQCFIKSVITFSQCTIATYTRHSWSVILGYKLYSYHCNQIPVWRKQDGNNRCRNSYYRNISCSFRRGHWRTCGYHKENRAEKARRNPCEQRWRWGHKTAKTPSTITIFTTEASLLILFQRGLFKYKVINKRIHIFRPTQRIQRLLRQTRHRQSGQGVSRHKSLCHWEHRHAPITV